MGARVVLACDVKEKQPNGQKSPFDELVNELIDGSAEVYGQRPEAWSMALLLSLEWKRFEELCQALLNDIGLHTACTSFGSDVDIEIFSKTGPKRVAAIVWCKVRSHPVALEQVMDLHAVMAARGIRKGYFITTAAFSDDACRLGARDGLSLISGRKLLQLISALPPAKSDRLLRLAAAGDYTVPTCPGCGAKMVAGKASEKSESRWRCLSAPRCKGALHSKQPA